MDAGLRPVKWSQRKPGAHRCRDTEAARTACSLRSAGPTEVPTRVAWAPVLHAASAWRSMLAILVRLNVALANRVQIRFRLTPIKRSFRQPQLWSRESGLAGRYFASTTDG